ncbi:hypothetical protein Neosp_006581 [[Neocosmospora] mangrovei]
MDATGEGAKGPAGLTAKAGLADQQNGDGQKNDLNDFQRLCVDLGLSGELGSKNKCRKEIKNVNVNIGQFLESKNKPGNVKFFEDKRALVKYTKKTKSFYPKDRLPKGDPLRALLKRMFV